MGQRSTKPAKKKSTAIASKKKQRTKSANLQCSTPSRDHRRFQTVDNDPRRCEAERYASQRLRIPDPRNPWEQRNDLKTHDQIMGEYRKKQINESCYYNKIQSQD
ncbi:unnamed protein product [Adineta steineri]|uniref:Uncharacterized protein n=1 Tax=Adineta steineri TaxID=433720 RepID=A0A818H461_9BILA|nr:unnamed protein product [Adineta steineri]CAF3502206.1 unnamed protein product [Adineta steineri]CAF3597062.1 unnamed protein product [Adineta steineri]